MDWNYLFTSFNGRLNRKPYWIAAILLMVAGIALQALVALMMGPLAGLAVGIVFLYPSFALTVKRAHDRNRPAWLVGAFFGLMILITLLTPPDIENTNGAPSPLFLGAAIVWLAMSLFFLVDLGFLRGTAGPNRYGPDPLDGK